MSSSAMQQLSNLNRHLTRFIRRLMPSLRAPPVPALFVEAASTIMVIDPHMFQSALPEDAALSKLVSIEFCKRESVQDKQHEFLVLHFTHPRHPTARATVITHRTVTVTSQIQKAALVSVASTPSTGARPLDAVDQVVLIGQSYTLADTEFNQSEKLCELQYLPSSSNSTTDPPSALQMSTLIITVSGFRRHYGLYDNNCYWFAEMVFEATRKLFPGYREVSCPKTGDRGRYVGVPLPLETTLPEILHAYHTNWQERPMKGEIVQVLQQELVEQRRGREDAENRVEEAERRLEEEASYRAELEKRLAEMMASGSRSLSQVPVQA